MVSFAAIFFFVAFWSSAIGRPGYPVILIPGDGGNQLLAKLDKQISEHVYCEKKTSDFYTLWLSLKAFIRPFTINCYIENLNTTSNPPGVIIKVPGWGETTTMEFLDPFHRFGIGSYFNAIVENLLTLGYERGVNVRGAPYDFRKAPNEMQNYFENLTNLVEETFQINGNRSVIFVAHSMGNLVTLYFLNRKTQEWKNKFIRSFVSISAPWGGSMKTLLLFASGYDLDHWKFVVPPLKMREQQRTMPSSAFLLPTENFWAPNETLLVTEKRNYSVSDYATFFKDINYTNGYMMWKDTKDLVRDLKPPKVEIHSLYGTEIQTPSKLIYGKNKFPDSQPKQIFEDGDGTVNIRSLRGFLKFKQRQTQNVSFKEFPKVDHLDILQNDDLMDYLNNLLFD